MQSYRESIRKLHYGETGPPLTGNNTGSRLSNPPPLQLSRQPSNRPGPGQGPPTNPVPATPSAPFSMGPEAGGLSNLTWDIGDFNQTFLGQDPGDLDFERDFGQWFNPGGDVTLDMK